MNPVAATLFWIIMLECLLATIYAGKFVLQYRRVNWRGSAWGVHIMLFSSLGAVLFGLTFIGNILAVVGPDVPDDWHDVLLAIWLLLNVFLFGAAAVGYRQRTKLEKDTNKIREERKQRQE